MIFGCLSYLALQIRDCIIEGNERRNRRERVDMSEWISRMERGLFHYDIADGRPVDDVDYYLDRQRSIVFAKEFAWLHPSEVQRVYAE